MKTFGPILLMLVSQLCFSQTLEQLLSQPTESNLAFSNHGRKMAWVINDKGVRNIMLRVEGESPKQFTNFTKDDGQLISQITFSANGTKLAFVKDGFLFNKDLSSVYSSLKIGEGTDPVFYPDGLKIAFLKQGQLFESSLDINPEIKLLTDVTGINFVKLSPAGNDLLFTGNHGKQINVGIISIADQKVRWITPDNGNDLFPCWSPDGKQIAFFRQQEMVAGISVCVADAETLSIKTIWNSKMPGDSFFDQHISKPIYWSVTNRILFYSEHTGWRHIFSMKPDGTDFKEITPGEYEVDNFTIDQPGQNIYFSSNKDDAERRHIWKSNLTGDNLVQITKGASIENDPFVMGQNLFCFKSTVSSTNVLTWIDEYRKTNLPVNATKPLQANYFVKPEAIAVPTTDGLSLGGQLFIDRIMNGKRIPLVFVHGGPQHQMVSGFPSSESYSNCYSFHQYLASLGYAVIAINYRGSSGYGRDFRGGSKPDSKKEILDVIAAAKFLQLLPEVEKTKVGVFGLDYGGNLVEQILAYNPEVFKAGVNIQVNDERSSVNLLKPAEIGKWNSAFLFIGNSGRVQSETELINKLKSKNVPVDVVTFQGESNITRENMINAFKSVQDFFTKNLK